MKIMELPNYQISTKLVARKLDRDDLQLKISNENQCPDCSCIRKAWYQNTKYNVGMKIFSC